VCADGARLMVSGVLVRDARFEWRRLGTSNHKLRSPTGPLRSSELGEFFLKSTGTLTFSRQTYSVSSVLEVDFLRVISKWALIENRNPAQPPSTTIFKTSRSGRKLPHYLDESGVRW
jgi:hypothetical protein